MSPLRTLMTACMLTAMLVVTSVAAAAPDPDQSAFVQGQKTLEGRLLAPCCWNQTLDVHESETSRTLRAEIRERLQKGETPDAIEAAIVARYGERIRAVPEGKSLTGMGVWLSIIFGVAGIGAAGLVVRWVRRDRAAKAKVLPTTGEIKGPDEWDARLDDELNNTDD